MRTSCGVSALCDGGFEAKEVDVLAEVLEGIMISLGPFEYREFEAGTRYAGSTLTARAMLMPRGKARLVERTADTSWPSVACIISEFSSVEGRPETVLDSSAVGINMRRGSGDGSPSAVYKSDCETEAGKDW